jgi:hypothetical protein
LWLPLERVDIGVEPWRELVKNYFEPADFLLRQKSSLERPPQPVLGLI